jgi:hypothetical protein
MQKVECRGLKIPTKDVGTKENGFRIKCGMTLLRPFDFTQDEESLSPLFHCPLFLENQKQGTFLIKQDAGTYGEFR